MPFVCIFEVPSTKIHEVVDVAGQLNFTIANKFYPVRAIYGTFGTTFAGLPVKFSDVRELWRFERLLKKEGIAFISRHCNK